MVDPYISAITYFVVCIKENPKPFNSIYLLRVLTQLLETARYKHGNCFSNSHHYPPIAIQSHDTTVIMYLSWVPYAEVNFFEQG
jgi:hypothetical protein